MLCPVQGCGKRVMVNGNIYQRNGRFLTHIRCYDHGDIKLYFANEGNMFQSSIPCPSCGSWYRHGERPAESAPCNKCQTVVIEPPDQVLTMRRENVGRQWSKKYHRYLTQKEISEGQKGG
jgi:hypothetical protein